MGWTAGIHSATQVLTYVTYKDACLGHGLFNDTKPAITLHSCYGKVAFLPQIGS